MVWRILIFIFSMLVVVYTTWASELCLRLNPHTVCTTSEEGYNTADVNVDCDGVSVHVVGHCSNNAGADGTVIDNLTLAENSADNIQCWCLITTPAASMWAWRYQYAKTGYTCAKNCTRGCRNGFIFDNAEDIAFREGLFKTLAK